MKQIFFKINRYLLCQFFNLLFKVKDISDFKIFQNYFVLIIVLEKYRVKRQIIILEAKFKINNIIFKLYKLKILKYINYNMMDTCPPTMKMDLSDEWFSP